jgi:putative SOS response-associated peptidase YedK
MRADLHYTLTHIASIADVTGARSVSVIVPRYNIAPGQTAPVALVRNGDRVCEDMRWGLLPRWRGHGGKRGPLIHAAPLEAVSGAPLLRDAFKKQRCLVIADGCFAWRELKQPIWFHPEPRRAVAFAGVWSVNDDDGQASFAMLLGPPLATRVRDLMPILLSPEAYEAWLDPMTKADEAIELLATQGADAATGWRADAVTTRMSSTQYDDPQCIAPVGNPNQGELF